MQNKTREQDSLVCKTTHASVTKNSSVRLGIAQKRPAQNRVGSSAGKDQQYCQSNFIFTLLQRLNLLSLCITASLGGPVGYLLPKLPITSALGPHHVKVVSISCRILLLHRSLTDSILLSLKPLWQDKESEEEGKEGGREKDADEKDGKVPGGRVKERDGERERATAVGAVSSVS